MKRHFFVLFLCFSSISVFSQINRIAILDFDNISGISKYDGLGKALSSMLISDIESNVSSKRLQLVERAQLNKIIKEQNLQKTSSFDKNTSVKLGKLLGVKYLLIGDIFILDNALVINARLTDVTSGDIKFSEKQEGKINEWLSIKTKLAKSVNTSLSMPFTEPRIPDAVISSAVLTTYANAIDENDKGNFEKAETLINTAKEFNPDFGYLDDLKDEVEKIKKQIAEQGKKIEILEKSDTLQNKKISTLETSDEVKGKQINTLEKSGGRVINAKSYDELKLNLTNQLTSYEEKKKIFVQMINAYPEKWDKIESGEFFNLFPKQYNLDQLGLNGCSQLLNDILESRKFIKKESLQSFDNSVYVFLGWSLITANKKVHFKHDFSDEDFIDFKRIVSIIIKNSFKNSAEQMFAHLIIMSNFNDDLKQFNKEVKSEIISIHKRIYELLKFSYGEQIVEQIQYSETKEADLMNYYTKTKLLASENLIVFLSAKREDYRYVYKLFKSLYMRYVDENSYKYYYENNEENKNSNNLFSKDMMQVFNYFSIPSFDTQNPYISNFRNEIFLNEFPEIIPLDESAKKAIIHLDSSTRRYTRIMNSLRSQNVSDPCRINTLKKWLIKQSDSIALISNNYVFNNKFELGSKVSLVFNSNRDTLIAYVVGKKITKTANEFEIIDNSIIKTINKNLLVTFFRNVNWSDFHDLKVNNIDYSNQKEFENIEESCEAQKRQEFDQKAREAYFNKQAEEYRQKEEQKKLAYSNKVNAVINLFAKKSINADTVTFFNLINKLNDDEIELDSLFNLAFKLLLEGSKNQLSNRKSDPKLDDQLSLLLNIHFINELGNRNINPVISTNFKYAATINLAHGYLLSAIKFGVNAFELAMQEYKNVPENFKFDKTFNSFTRNKMIASDWNDFISKGLVTKSQIDSFNKEFKILNDF